VISLEEADRLRDELLEVLAEDAHNTQRLLTRLDEITKESGISAYAALLLILTRLPFEEQDARRHWQAILEHHQLMTAALDRDAGIRVAVLDYFMNVNRRLTQPTLIDLKMLDSGGGDPASDRLTGLATNKAFHTAVQHELRRARRYRQKAAVVLFDIDDFAGINDRFGSLVADRLLREAGILLSNKIRDIDIAARPGEDELALLLPETGGDGALLVAERFRSEVEKFFGRREIGGSEVNLTLCAGAASYPEDAATPDTLLESAARALYQAKASGKNSVQLFRPERRRYIRFELEPGRFEVEVLSPPDHGAGRLRNLSRNGILFSSPEALHVGEEIEIRLVDGAEGAAAKTIRMRCRVVRLEELPPAKKIEVEEGGVAEDIYEIGVAFDLDWGEGSDDLLNFLEKVQNRNIGHGS
jgi:diguanylate cyclase (GGDEF)-like protein